MNTEPKDPAFAFVGQGFFHKGLTKREHFAALALQGLLANPSWSGSSTAVFASDSVQAADALIEALNAPKKP